MERYKLLATNLNYIKKRIAQIQKQKNFAVTPILVAVTKTRTAEDIYLLYKLGVRHFGESYVQEAIEKWEKLDDFADFKRNEIKLHLIGHLQRNKARHAVQFFDMIQSLDREPLAKKLNALGQEFDKKIPVLVQIDIDGTKYGVDPDDVLSFIQNLATMEFLQIQGLMCIAPYVEKEKTRPFFKKMVEISNLLRTELKDQKNFEMKYLSMGMSNDFEIALEEGANMIRIGSLLFRPVSDSN